jgi:hypothetical protein
VRSQVKVRTFLLVVCGLALGLLPISISSGAALADPAPSGPTWTIESSPNVSGATASTLAAVSCRAKGSCMAVGTYFKGPNGDQSALAEQLKGTNWSIEPTPPITGVHYSLLSGVSCAGPTMCMAVGYTATSRANTTVRALAEQWNGTAWAIDPTPLPTLGTWWVTLSDVSCPAVNDCLAVGAYIRHATTSEEQPLTERWNGTSWSIVATPNPRAEDGSSFNGIDCVSTTRCEVVGEYAYADVAQSLIAYSYNGSTWTAQKPANPSGQESNSVNSVACTDVDACMLAGNWTSNFPERLAEYWDGTSWSRQRLPHPAKSETSTLSGASCAASNSCTVVGQAGDNSNDYPSSPVAFTWNGTSWQLDTVPNPADSSSSLAAVSCVTGTDCVAVGASYTSSLGATLVEVS